MNRLRQTIVAIASLIIIAAVVSVLFVSVVYVAAIVAPLIGLAYAAIRANTARGLWRSHGRFPLPGEGIRIIDASRARTLAVLELFNGAGGFLVSLIIPAIVFGHHALVIPALAAGLVLMLGANSGRRRLVAGSHPVDLLPPE